jgi:hypothetical protein
MRRLPAMPRVVLLACLLASLADGPVWGQQSQLPGPNPAPGSAVPPDTLSPGASTRPIQSGFQGISATATTGPFPGVDAIPINQTPLSDRPYVYALERRSPGQMTSADASVVTSLSPELDRKAALLRYDLASPGWSYRQVVCPAFPDYVLLTYTHGPDPNGSSLFVAVLERDGRKVRIVSSYSHGMLPSESAWSKSSTRDVFNEILLQERGNVSLSVAPNWLVIGMCFAELSGTHVQVFTDHPQPNATLDMLRLEANQPQMQIDSDRSADVTFADASKPSFTTQWTLHFDRRGQLTGVERDRQRQAQKIALNP